MAKPFSNKKSGEKPSRELLDPVTQRTIWGIASFTFGVILALAFFGLAGPAGDVVRRLLFFFFGRGYFLVPLSFFLVGGLLFLNRKDVFYFSSILGVGIFVLALLGIFDHFQNGTAGFFGNVAGSVSNLFGFWAGLVILLAAALSGLLLGFQNVFLARREKSSRALEVFSSLPPVVVREAEKPREELKPPKDASAKDKGAEKEEEIRIQKPRDGVWHPPPLELLRGDEAKPASGDIRTNSLIIRQTLEHFGIPVEMANVHIGPTVTQYTLKPAQGVKLSKIVALQSDLSLALASHPLRIEAPIPGQALVGIEVPNKSSSIVRLRNLLEDSSLRNAGPLSFPLGRDVMGNPMVADLSLMPHLLVAGATGSGKSIFIHDLVLSLIFRNPPDSLRFLMIDPKRVELSQYEGIPYLLSPVITQGKKAVLALRWAISEMDRRYDLLLANRARDIASFNARSAKDDGGPLPFVVIVIDELADLMAAYGREVEGSITRLSQMARATGIHLVVSTQRPSVEVITGLIKANITSRIAFQVASQVDSRTILDTAGAEKLLGRGDMLFLASDTPKPKRIQAPLIEEGEVKRVVNFLKDAAASKGIGAAVEDRDSLEEVFGKEAASEGGELGIISGDDDELYQQAYEVIRQAKKASASLLQRRLKVGYARAARLLDLLEARGVIGPGKGAKPREVFIEEGEKNDGGTQA
jgi:S-DNA-T family DNA segregation ATPase FtsK/SpoIIIE